jgi:hypothetical protein
MLFWWAGTAELGHQAPGAGPSTTVQYIIAIESEATNKRVKTSGERPIIGLPKKRMMSRTEESESKVELPGNIDPIS